MYEGAAREAPRRRSPALGATPPSPLFFHCPGEAKQPHRGCPVNIRGVSAARECCVQHIELPPAHGLRLTIWVFILLFFAISRPLASTREGLFFFSHSPVPKVAQVAARRSRSYPLRVKKWRFPASSLPSHFSPSAKRHRSAAKVVLLRTDQIF